MPDTIEKRVSDLKEMVWDIPRLLNIRFDAVRDQLQAQGAQLNAQGERLNAQGERLDSLEAKVDALPRVLAETLTEMLDERERRKS